jgi:hypothetical protein
MTRDRAPLAQRQADLIASLVAGAPVPPGFDPVRVAATAEALLHKRAGEVGARWPALRTQFGPEWSVEFSRWARHRLPRGSLTDGWDFARDLRAAGRLGDAARAELAATEVRHRYRATRSPRRRRAPAVSLSGDMLAVQVGGRVWVIRRPF